MRIIDSYDFLCYKGQKVDGDIIEVKDEFSIFQDDAILTHRYLIDERNNESDTVSIDKDIFT